MLLINKSLMVFVTMQQQHYGSVHNPEVKREDTKYTNPWSFL